MKTIFALLSTIEFFAMGAVVDGQTNMSEAAGLYHIVPTNGWEAVKATDDSTIWLGAKSEIQILKAHVFSVNNENTSFHVYLDTSDYPVDPKTGALTNGVVLRVGERAYVSNGGGGRTGSYNLMTFQISNREEAEAAAKALSTECILRAPPGYKFLTRFIPDKSEYHADEPVKVKLSIKNLDERTMVFQNGGAQRGPRNNQYGFRVMLYNTKPVPDTGDPVNFGGPSGLLTLESGKEFTDQVDLKKWFNFDKPGNYYIHGFYALTFYRGGKMDSTAGWNVMWSEYAAADFEVDVK